MEREAEAAVRRNQEAAAEALSTLGEFNAAVREENTRCCSRCGQKLPASYRPTIFLPPGDRRIDVAS